MIAAIRNVELSLGSWAKTVGPGESKNLPLVRRSIVASRDIIAGEVFSENNLCAKRPGQGISPMRWDEVVGQVAQRDFAANELIQL